MIFEKEREGNPPAPSCQVFSEIYFLEENFRQRGASETLLLFLFAGGFLLWRIFFLSYGLFGSRFIRRSKLLAFFFSCSGFFGCCFWRNSFFRSDRFNGIHPVFYFFC